jgi:hypothetical protein
LIPAATTPSRTCNSLVGDVEIINPAQTDEGMQRSIERLLETDRLEYDLRSPTHGSRPVQHQDRSRGLPLDPPPVPV